MASDNLDNLVTRFPANVERAKTCFHGIVSAQKELGKDANVAIAFRGAIAQKLVKETQIGGKVICFASLEK